MFIKINKFNFVVTRISPSKAVGNNGSPHSGLAATQCPKVSPGEKGLDLGVFQHALVGLDDVFQSKVVFLL